MGFIDKVKASVKSGAEMAATKAQEEYEKLQARRELAQAYEDLGTKAFELSERGELSNPGLTPLVEQVRAAKTKLEAAGTEKPEEAATTPEPEPAAEEQAPPT
jgi:hypothetical protein